MPHIDKTLRNLVDHKFYLIRYEDPQAHRRHIVSQILAKLEAEGDAMRFVGRNGEIAWKATPQLHADLAGEQTEAEIEAEEFEDD